MILSKLFKKVFLTESTQEFPRTVALVGAVLTTALIPKKGKEEKNDIDDSHLSIQVGEQYEGE